MKKQFGIDVKPSYQENIYPKYAMNNQSKKDSKLSDKKMNSEEKMKRIIKLIKVSIAVSPFVISLNSAIIF